ncbi:transcriptional regulator GcvA [Aestuariibius sp. HNIBRBA575]|uniref:transcriptional regulator GcvA n=1 Tax=Aestuariibius sp. HNIBRBA575 TaxID=3233343 RepID=UPI0034A3CE9D
MRDLPPLNSLKAFEAAARNLNFSHAAQELGVTQGAVAQHVRSLELLLEIKLFNRHARGLTLTDEGRKYFPAIRRAFDMISEATGGLSPQDTVVTISSTPSFATKWLVPKLSSLARDHPEIRVRLDASNSLANFQTDGVDIAIRQGKPPFGPGLVATPLFPARLVAVCSPDLISGAAPIHGPNDLLGHVLLEDTHGQWPIFLEAALGEQNVSGIRTMTFSQTSLAIDAAIARQGVALANRELVKADLRAGLLVQPFEFSMTSENGYYVVAPRAPRKASVVATLSAWLFAQVSSA